MARPMPPVSPCAPWPCSGTYTPTGLVRAATTRRGARRSTTSMASSITPTGSTTCSSPPPWEGENYEPRNPMESAYLNLDGGFDSTSNRKAIFNAGLMPNIKENPRNRKTPKCGRKRWFNQAIHALRERVERTFVWEDKFKRLLLRFEYHQRRHYGMKLMAYTLINLRRFCAT